MTTASTLSTRTTSLYLSMASTYLLSVYQPENRLPDILSLTKKAQIKTKPRSNLTY